MKMNHYKDKVVLITGHTGFKGSWLSIWLAHLGAKVVGVSLDLPSEPANFEVSGLKHVIEDHRLDVRDVEALRDVIHKVQPDFVFHLAAQALVRSSYEQPLDTMSINAMGSANVLDSLRTIDKPVVAVMITSDKAYDNVEWVWGYRETDRLGGKDPYSASKGMAELAIRSYVESFFASSDSNVRIGITRAGNVIGGGDWAKDRIVPDCMRAWSVGEGVDIRYPNATRPWQHVLEPLSGYLSLGVELAISNDKHGEAYNFGPPSKQNHSVQNLIEEMARYWESVCWNDISQGGEYLPEAGLLKLDCDKALSHLNWRPALEFEETVRMTVEWYKLYYENSKSNMYDFSISQINEFTSLAESRGIMWAGK